MANSDQPAKGNVYNVLAHAGWHISPKNHIKIHATRGVVNHHFPLHKPLAGCDAINAWLGVTSCLQSPYLLN